ncbi:SdpI family protein [Candidatus Undinarchaeota archaeon]
MNKKDWIAFGIVALTFLIGISLYSSFPEKMASHWNETGQVDGYLSKFWGTFLFPMINLGLLGLFILIPEIAVFKLNIKKFKKEFDNFKLIFVGFMSYVYLATLFANLGYDFSMNYIMAPAMFLLFYYVGHLTMKSKRNFFIGIRTPWTLANDKVWEKTNRIGGRLLQVLGVIMLIGLLVKGQFISIILGSVFLFVIFIFVYSYLEYRKYPKKNI